MHTFDVKSGLSRFEFAAAPTEQVWLVGDFNGWGARSMPLQFKDGRWALRLRLQAGCYQYAFQLRDGFYAGGIAEVPLWFGRMTDEWMQQALHRCTCCKHFWKWN